MLAAQMFGIQDIRLDDVPLPEINDYELLVKVRSVGICGTDLRIIKNGLAGIDANSPRILGHEFSGTIVKAGQFVNQFNVGMRVAVAPNMGCGSCKFCIRSDHHLCDNYQAIGVQMDGAFAEYVRIPEAAVRHGNVFELAANTGFDESAINEPLSCVYNGLQQCPIHLGDDVLIIGAGPIGTMYAMMAKLSGASRVFINNRSTERLKICKELDDSFITVETADLKDTIMRMTDGKGIDVCVTANPSPEAQQLAIELAAMRGKINFFGGLPKDRQEVLLNTNIIHYKQLLVTGSTKANNEHFSQTLKFIATGILNVQKLITARYKLTDIQAAIDYAVSSKGIKTIIEFDE